jgi:hypothetical protein
MRLKAHNHIHEHPLFILHNYSRNLLNDSKLYPHNRSQSPIHPKEGKETYKTSHKTRAFDL